MNQMNRIHCININFSISYNGLKSFSAVAAPETQRYKTTSATVNDLDLTTVYRDRNNPCPLSLELV